MPWSIDTVKREHAILMDGVGQTEPGRIRETEVSVYGSDGTELFRACPAGHVVSELGSLVEWLNNSPYESIVTASLFFHEFESIHPFEDGNGRAGCFSRRC